MKTEELIKIIKLFKNYVNNTFNKKIIKKG